MSRLHILVFLFSFLVFSAGNFCAVRSPDSEIQFRAAESLAFRGTPAVEQGLSAWQGFGTAKANNGLRYSIFGPLQPLVLEPVLSATDGLAQYVAHDTRIPLPASHYVGNFESSVKGIISAERLPHARRFVASVINPLLGALAVTAFFAAMLTLVGSASGAVFAAAALAFATPLWSYTGTYFSETLAVALLLVSFSGLMSAWRSTSIARDVVLLFAAGVFFGLACAAHISALLWLPFFAVLVSRYTNSLRDLLHLDFAKALAPFLAGVIPGLAGIGWYNWVRFESVFETGRFIDAEAARGFGYGFFVLPVESLLGLSFSGGKGLFVFAPILVLALLCWRNFMRQAPWLAKVLLAGAAFRFLVIAMRSDWHGGFALGPRYLLLAIPLLLPALAYAWHARRQRALYFAVLAVCIFEQAYLCCGEIFAFYHSIVGAAGKQGVDVFSADALYLNWSYSPLLGFLDLTPAPYAMRLLGLSFFGATALLTLLALSTSLLWLRVAEKE